MQVIFYKKVSQMQLSTFLKLKRMTQRDFAKAVKLDEATVSRLISGPQMPTSSTIKKVEKYTKKQVTWVDLIAPKVDK
jgi:transcriptional regulator with XRE-family HTH domain